MKRFNSAQRKIVTEFWTTIASGWFVAGVITTIFIRPIVIVNAVVNLTVGIFLAYITLQYALYLERK